MLPSSSQQFDRVSVRGLVPEVEYIGSVRRNFETNEEYVAFYHVPYAKVPVGLERYQAPQAPQAPVYDSGEPIHAYKMKRNESVQVLHGTKVHGSQDCLYLNIFLPKRPKSLGEERLPVLVFFHGGEFCRGSNHPEKYTPDSIIQHGVIFITVSYRLGLHGFFSTQTQECPGNAGLKDQVRALEWIRDNIEIFKGDPKNVTISGSGAGGTCVNLHLISPMSKGLFHKAIVQSGGVYTTRGCGGHRVATRRLLMAHSEFRSLLLEDEDSASRYILAWQLLRKQRELRHPHSMSPLLGPTIEKIEEGAFIPRKIEEMMKAQVDPNIPIMAGIHKDEALYQFIVPDSKFEICLREREHFVRFLADNFRWSEETADRCLDKITEKYFGNMRLSENSQKMCFAKLMTDISFRRFFDNFKFGPEKTLHPKLYVYEFGYYSELNWIHHTGFDDAFPGVVTHGDDLRYLYLPQSRREHFKDQLREDSEIKKVTQHMCSLWANFCKTGEPKSDFAPNNVEWKPHSWLEPCYLKINQAAHLVVSKETMCYNDWHWLNSCVDAEEVVPSIPPSP